MPALTLALLAGLLGAQPELAPRPPAPAADTAAVRIFLLSDAHSRHRRFGRFVETVNRERPDLVLEAGDLVHDGTQTEFDRALAARARLQPPWHVAPGNHDLTTRGPFTRPPPGFPEVRVEDHPDLRIVLLDNSDETITDAQFERLEAALEGARDRRVLVVMHVPPMLGRKPFMIRLRHALPYRLASPTMREPDQVERFMALMARHDVLAVLAGHTHFPDEYERDGVRYVVAGAFGGLTPGFGIANEYVDLTIDGRELRVRRVRVAPAPREPIRFLARAFRFYAELNGLNHAEQGWNYVPSASVQLRGGLARIEANDRTDLALRATASFERLLGAGGRQSFVGDPAILAGDGTLAAELALGYRVRPLGDFNRGVFLGAGVAGSAGVLGGRAAAGVGAHLGGGVEWHHLSLDLAGTWATHHRATRAGIGYRF